jgi:hypothetical protein
MAPSFRRLALVALLAAAATASHAAADASETTRCTLPELERTWQRGAEATPDGTTRTTQPPWIGRTESLYRVRLQPCRDNDCGKFGFRGWLPVAIPAPARYRVAIDQMLWIDARGSQGILDGVLCEHAGCAPIRKIVQYDFPAGTHWISLAGKLEGVVGVLLSRVPEAEPASVAPPWKH